jgi:hypothetical protein
MRTCSPPDEYEGVAAGYGSNAARLLELKRRYEPEVVFASATGALLPAS